MRIAITVIPDALESAASSGLIFFVKGGRAVDAYLPNPIGSPDWDLIAPRDQTEELEKFVVRYISERVKGARGILKTVGVSVQYPGDTEVVRGRQIGISCESEPSEALFVIDIVPYTSTSPPPTPKVIKGVPYAPVSYLIDDLRRTAHDRDKNLVDMENELSEIVKESRRLQDIAFDELDSGEYFLDLAISKLTDEGEKTQIEDALETYKAAISNLKRYSGASDARTEEEEKIAAFRVKTARTHARLDALLAFLPPPPS